MTPFQRFLILAKVLLAVPKDAIREPKKDKPQHHILLSRKRDCQSGV